VCGIQSSSEGYRCQQMEDDRFRLLERPLVVAMRPSSSNVDARRCAATPELLVREPGRPLRLPGHVT
jgi:hypothetical protein